MPAGKTRKKPNPVFKRLGQILIIGRLIIAPKNMFVMAVRLSFFRTLDFASPPFDGFAFFMRTYF